MDTNYNPFSLKGKTILVTGASSGIGQGVAIECSKMGAKMIITGRDEQRLQETYELLEGDDHQKIVVDISNIDGIEQLVDSIPVVDGLLNNAGISSAKPISFISEIELESLFSINLNTPIYLTNLMIKRKKVAKGGSIVFTSSIGRYLVTPGNSMYAASKGGLSAFMKCAAIELANKNIRCNAILPGMIETPFMRKKDSISEEQWEINKQMYPLKRFGTPQEVAWLVVYLFSDASRFMTGSELVIDGGRSLR
jgi:NAD(P)-dependent dehydrogenase (short-subunit alcohol dehydrogenase family)